MHKILTDPETNGGELMFAGLMIPLGLAAYMVYLHYHVGDAMAFSNIQRAWDRGIGNPVTVFLTAFEQRPFNQFLAMMALFSLGMSVYLAVQREFGLALFLAFVTLIPLSTGLTSMMRYVLLQPPLLLGLGLLICRYRWLYLLLPGAISGYVFMTYAWLEGFFFVI